MEVYGPHILGRDFAPFAGIASRRGNDGDNCIPALGLIWNQRVTMRSVIYSYW